MRTVRRIFIAIVYALGALALVVIIGSLVVLAIYWSANVASRGWHRDGSFFGSVGPAVAAPGAPSVNCPDGRTAPITNIHLCFGSERHEKRNPGPAKRRTPPAVKPPARQRVQPGIYGDTDEGVVNIINALRQPGPCCSSAPKEEPAPPVPVVAPVQEVQPPPPPKRCRGWFPKECYGGRQ